MKNPKILELFAGYRSVGKVADKLGIESFSVDILNLPNIDLVKDIAELQPSDIPFIPNVVWASPPCETYSIATPCHRIKGSNAPKSEKAKLHDRLNIKLHELLKHYHRLGALIYVENPMGHMRKQDFVKWLDRSLVTYCSYGDNRMKPTDIFTNNKYSPIFNPLGWKARHICHNNNPNCKHERAPRSSTNTGTFKRKTYLERSAIPAELIHEILIASVQKLKHEGLHQTHGRKRLPNGSGLYKPAPADN